MTKSGKTIEARSQAGAGKIAWRKRIGRRMEQPSHARRRTKKPEPATGPISREAKRGNHAEPNRTGQPWPKVSSEPARPTRSCPFFACAQRPRSAARAEGARMNTLNVPAGRLERRVRRAGRDTVSGIHGFCSLFPFGAIRGVPLLCLTALRRISNHYLGS